MLERNQAGTTGQEKTLDSRNIPELACARCQKRLSKKTARMIDGKLICSACLFPPLRKGIANP